MATIMADMMLRLRANSAELQKEVETSKKSVSKFNKYVGKSNKAAAKSYSNLSKGVSGSLGKISQSLSGMGAAGGEAGSAFSSLASGAGSLSAALGPVSIALAAVGLAVAALKSYFTNTTEGAGKFQEIMGYISAALSYFSDLLADVGKWLVKAFEDPKTAVDDLWKAIKENLINRFQGFVNMFKEAFQAMKDGFYGVGNAIKGMWSDDAKKKADEYFASMNQHLVEVGKNAIQATTGFKVDELAKKGAKALEEMNKRGKEGAALGRRKFDLEMANIKLTYKEADARAKISKLILESRDIEGKTFAERKAALDEALKLNKDIYNEKVRLAKEAYDIQVAENKISKSGPEALKKEAELYKQLKAAEEERDNRLRMVVNRQNEITKKLVRYGKEYVNMTETEVAAAKKAETEKAKAAADAEKKKLAEQKKAEAERLKIAKQAQASLQAYRLSKEEDSQAKELRILKDKYDKGLILREEYEGRKQDIIDKWNQIMQQRQDEAFKQSFEGIASWGDTYMGYMNGLLSSIQNMWQASKEAELKAAGDNEKKKEQIERKYANKQKSVAIAQAMINGALGITKAFAQLGPIGGAIAAGLIAATTATQIAVISSQKFAKGGIVKGETNAVVGEYAGARSNPEIISPLSDLRKILTGVLTKDLFKKQHVSTGRIPNSLNSLENIKFIIEGDDLVAVLDRQELKNNIY